MLIRLIEIDTSERLARALRDPIRQEDRALFTTCVPEYARRLAAAGLPCIYREPGAPGRDLPRGAKGPAGPDSAGEPEPDGTAGIYGVDLVICGDADDPRADTGNGGCADGGWRADSKLLLNVWKRHYHIPWTIARTGRLLIRESVPEDLPELLLMYEEERGNPDVKPFSDEPGRELEAYIRERYPFFGYGLWSVVERETGRVVGRVGFEEWTADDGVCGGAGRTALQLSYLIAGEARRRGYAGEAARAALAYAGENLAPARVVLVTSRENTASRRLAESLGFREAEGEKRNFINSLDKHVIYVYDV